MFSDLVGFTELAQRLGAERTRGPARPDRHRVRSARSGPWRGEDQDDWRWLHGRRRLEPASGRPSCAARTHGAEVAGSRFSATHGVNLKIRVGLDSGPVMAGVIGADKFSYDVWGETVNLASRLESHGLPGEVQISDKVKGALGN